MLVSRSADKSCKDKLGYTPLHAAAASGHIEIVKYLLRMGAEVSGYPIILYTNILSTNLCYNQFSVRIVHHQHVKSDQRTVE